MVGPATLAFWILAASDKQTLLEKLDPERRAAVVLALIGIGLLGVLLVTIVMLAGRWARHPAPRRPSRLATDATGPPAAEDPPTPDESASPGETQAGRSTSSDTLRDGPGERR